jgi:hypothetical protein
MLLSDQHGRTPLTTIKPREGLMGAIGFEPCFEKGTGFFCLIREGRAKLHQQYRLSDESTNISYPVEPP